MKFNRILLAGRAALPRFICSASPINAAQQSTLCAILSFPDFSRSHTTSHARMLECDSTAVVGPMKIRTRRRAVTLPVHRCFSSRTCASKFDDHLTDLQQQQQQQQQPAAASSYPQMHIHQLMHLVNRCSLKDLHSFGCSLMWEQVPGRTLSHIADVERIADLKAYFGHHDHWNGHQQLQEAHGVRFQGVVQAAVARKREALNAFQNSVAQSLPHLCGGASQLPLQQQQQQHQQYQQQLQGESLEKCDLLSLDVVTICEALLDLKLQVDAEAVRLPGDLQQCTEMGGWWDDGQRVQAVDAVMDCHEAYTLSVRLLVSEYLSAWGHWQQREGRRGPKLVTVDQKLRERERWSMAGPAGPPGFDPHAPPPPLINQAVPLVPLLELAAEDARALCVEKNSTAPAVTVVPLQRAPHTHDQKRSGHPPQELPTQPHQRELQQLQQQFVPVILAAYVEHVFNELLKNAMQALLEKWGAWDVDEAEPILVEVDTTSCASSPMPCTRSATGNPAAEGETTAPFFIIRLTDTAGGIPQAKLQSLFHYFGTTHAPREPTYGYSRDFGAQFQGKGVGAPLSQLYTRFMGGSMQWALLRKDGQELPLLPEQALSGKRTCIQRSDTALHKEGEPKSDGAAILGTRITILLPCHGFAF